MGKILIINNAEPGIIEFVEPLQKIVGQEEMPNITIEYAAAPEFDFTLVDGILLSGSPQGDDIVAHHLPYFQWLKKIDKPVLGICAGHHIAGCLFGSGLLRSKEPESGDVEIEILKTDPLFSGIPKKITVKQMHNDSITLPEDFELLATSLTCRNQFMKHKTKPLYTCQFHPEYYNQDLIRNFLK
ncbi:MAG: glutamine amidotransferase-related protein, partial [Tangfeifania sp.]